MTQNPVSRRSVLAGGLAGAAALTLPASALAAPGRAARHGTFDVVDKSVMEVLQALGTGRTTSQELVSSYLARIDAYDGSTTSDTGLNAIITRNHAALELAAQMDAERRKGHRRGVLHGVPIIMKDNYLTHDLPTSAGSIALATYQSLEDSTVVARLRAAGAIILAKANMSEFAWHGTYTRSSIRGTTHNAFNRAYSSAGSSGGSAVAVAASFAPAAFGTDSCGSIIGPSAHSSSIGFRPTMGRVSVNGVVPLSVRQDVAGPIARTVADAALLAQVVAGYDPADAQTKPYRTTPNLTAGLRRGALRGRRIGYLNWTRAQWDALNTAGHPGVDEVLAATAHALTDLRAAGAHLVPLNVTYAQIEAALPSGGWIDARPSIDSFFAKHPAHWPAGLAAKTAPKNRLTFSDIAADGRSSLEASVISDWLAQANIPNPTYTADVTAQDKGKRRIDEFFVTHGLDAVAAPTCIALATTDWAATTFCDIGANTGVPSISVPSGMSKSGLPIGLELLGRRGQDATLLAMAHDYTMRTRHHRVPTSLPAL